MMIFLGLAERATERACVAEQQVSECWRTFSRQHSGVEFRGQCCTANIETVLPTRPAFFPDFYENRRLALAGKQGFLREQLREDSQPSGSAARPTNVLNEGGWRHYGIPGIHWQRVARGHVDARGAKGLLGQGSVFLR